MTGMQRKQLRERIREKALTRSHAKLLQANGAMGLIGRKNWRQPAITMRRCRQPSTDLSKSSNLNQLNAVSDRLATKNFPKRWKNPIFVGISKNRKLTLLKTRLKFQPVSSRSQCISWSALCPYTLLSPQLYNSIGRSRGKPLLSAAYQQQKMCGKGTHPCFSSAKMS